MRWWFMNKNNYDADPLLFLHDGNDQEYEAGKRKRLGEEGANRSGYGISRLAGENRDFSALLDSRKSAPKVYHF